MTQREQYIVELERPAGVTKTQMKAYIEAAIGSWAGGGDPDNPLADIVGSVIQVRAVTKPLRLRRCGKPERPAQRRVPTP